MKNLFSKVCLSKVLMFGLTMLTPSLQAARPNAAKPNLAARQNFSENVTIGTADSNKILTVHGESRLKGNVAVTGNTTITQDSGNGCCKRIFGMVNDFDPHTQQLALHFCDTDPDNKPNGAVVELQFCGKCTEKANTSNSKAITVLNNRIFVYPVANEDNSIQFITSQGSSSPNGSYIDDAAWIGDTVTIDDADAHLINSNTSSDSDNCSLSLAFRKDSLRRICIGLAHNSDCGGDDDSQVYGDFNDFYEGFTYYTFEPGCLFYQVTSCNLLDVHVTGTKDSSVELLGQEYPDILTLIQQVTSNTAEQEAIADQLIALGDFFGNAFIDLAQSVQLAIITEIFNDLSLGRSVIINKIKECVQAKDTKKLMAILKSIK